MPDDTNMERRRLIQGIKVLPPAPFILTQVLDCIDNPKSCANDLKEVILQDQALTAKILSLANSAYFGYTQRITDVTRAIVVLGFQTVLETTLSISVLSNMGEGLKSGELNIADFWKYCLVSAEAAKTTAGHVEYDRAEQAYIIGLLHDLGKLVLLSCFGNEYDDILFTCRAEECSLAAKEEDVFQFDHTLAGRWLGEKWKLPTELVAAISLHHVLDTLPQDHRTEICLAHVAEYLTRTLRVGSNGEVMEPHLHPNVTSALRLKDSDVADLKTECEKELPKLEAMFSAILS